MHSCVSTNHQNFTMKKKRSFTVRMFFFFSSQITFRQFYVTASEPFYSFVFNNTQKLRQLSQCALTTKLLNFVFLLLLRCSCDGTSIGQNLAISTNPDNEQMVINWADEKQWYTASNNTCNPPTGKSCGHYTAVSGTQSYEQNTY